MFWQPVSQELIDQGITKKWIIIDDAFYHVYYEKEGLLEEVTTMPHQLGYVPARQFWSESTGKSTILKQNQVAKNLGHLDWLLYTMVTERHLELYAGFPIISVFEQECGYRDKGFYCEDGVLYAENPEIDEHITNRQSCPRCNSGKSLVGAGSIIEAPSIMSNDSPNTQMPMLNITQGDVASLQAMSEKVQRYVQDFIVNMIGYGGDPSNDQAMNMKQVVGSFESRATVLNRLARGFESIHKFMVDTIGDLRYGEGYKGSIVFYGSIFFLQTVDDMQESYRIAKEGGVPNFDLADRRKSIYRKQYHNNAQMLQRVQMLSDLEPLEDYSLTELSNLEKMVTKEQMMLKINFNDLIQKFELMNGPIQEYFPERKYEARIIDIRAQLLEWVNEILTANEEKAKENAAAFGLPVGQPPQNGQPPQEEEEEEEEK